MLPGVKIYLTKKLIEGYEAPGAVGGFLFCGLPIKGKDALSGSKDLCKGVFFREKMHILEAKTAQTGVIVWSDLSYREPLRRVVMEKLDRMLLTIGRGKVYNRIIAETEKELIEGALMKAFGNQSIASKILGINRNTMRAKIRKLNIDPAQFRI